MLLNSRSSYQREWLNGPPKYTDVLWFTFAAMDMAQNNLMLFWDVGWDGILAGWKDICEVNEECYNNYYKTRDIKHEINNFINKEWEANKSRKKWLTMVFNAGVNPGDLQTLDFYYTISNPFSLRFW